jgi:serine protease DegQ
MSDAVALSHALAAAVEATAPAVVRVAGESHGTSGLAWGDNLVIAVLDAIDEAEALRVVDADGRETPAEIAGRDAALGIIVLRAAGLNRSRPNAADLGALKVGHLVVAVARPGKSARAAFGIVSTLGDTWRTRSGARIDRYIDTSLVLPSEFGGGVIVDAAGRLVGFGVPGGRGRRGVIVPVPTLERAVAGVLSGKSDRRGYLGVATYPVRLPKSAGQEQERGLLVVEVEDDSPAARAGLTLGDVVLSMGGTRVEQLSDLFGALADAGAGGNISAHILRAGKPVNVSVTVGARP